jgi:hypothetical protein
MPIPKPKKGETKYKFLSRFMSDNTMNKEFPDIKQRYAVANTQWKNKKSNKRKKK